MRRALLILCLALALLPLARGGDIVSAFVPGRPGPSEALPQVEVKSLVAEFLDPGDTGLGKSLGYLLWRETLTAISDQAGAGVILARPPGDQRLTDLLSQDYHRAGVELARAQNARMVLWGAVGEGDGTVRINTYLTLLPELIGDDLRINLVVTGRPQEGFVTEIPRTRYTFAAVDTTRARLFQRAVVTRTTITLRASPGGDAKALGQVPAGQALEAIDMQGAWFQVRYKNGKAAWVENSQVDVPPREVRAQLQGASLRKTPAGAPLRQANLSGDYRVLDMRYVAGKGSWYRLDLPGKPAWIAAYTVEPRFSLPVVDYMAGLQRYQRRNWPEAAKAFQRYIRATQDWENNINLASADQMLAASMLAAGAPASLAMQTLDRAAALTPYDPAVYNLRAMVRVAAEHQLRGSHADLQQALTLDAQDMRARTLLDAFIALSGRDDHRYDMLRYTALPTPADREAFETLKVRLPPVEAAP